MMKTLILIRASNSEKAAAGNDRDRSLSSLGRRDATVMADKLQEIAPNVDAVTCSTAARAYATADIFAGKFGKPVETDELIYGADSKTLLNVVRALNNIDNTVVLIGHNPGLTDFLCDLTGISYNPFLDTGVAVLNCRAKKWKKVSFGGAQTQTTFSPRAGTLRATEKPIKLIWYDRFLQWRFSKAHRFEILMALLLGIIIAVAIVAVFAITSSGVKGGSGFY